jgi:hypothetical protein
MGRTFPAPVTLFRFLRVSSADPDSESDVSSSLLDRRRRGGEIPGSDSGRGGEFVVLSGSSSLTAPPRIGLDPGPLDSVIIPLHGNRTLVRERAIRSTWPEETAEKTLLQ